MKTTTLRSCFQACLFTSHAEHDGRPAELFWDADGVPSVNGCRPSPGMVLKVTSLPYRHVGGDLWTMGPGDTVAVLADGRQVVLGPAERGHPTFRMDAMGGERVASIVEAAARFTPAE